MQLLEGLQPGSGVRVVGECAGGDAVQGGLMCEGYPGFEPGHGGLAGYYHSFSEVGCLPDSSEPSALEFRVQLLEFNSLQGSTSFTGVVARDVCWFTPLNSESLNTLAQICLQMKLPLRPISLFPYWCRYS